MKKYLHTAIKTNEFMQSIAFFIANRYICRNITKS